LSRDERKVFLRPVKRMGDSGEIKDKAKLNTFKPKPDRFLYFSFDGKKIIVTNAFRKK